MDVHLDRIEMKGNEVLWEKESLAVHYRVHGQLARDLKTPRLFIRICTCWGLFELSRIKAQSELVSIQVDPRRDRSECGNWVDVII